MRMALKSDQCQFLSLFGLKSIKKSTPKQRPQLYLRIDLTPATKEQKAMIPKTPCSMLSPLTPKVRQVEYLDDTSNDSSESVLPNLTMRNKMDNKCSWTAIDLVSPLGKRILLTISALFTKTQAVSEYSSFCNRICPDVDKRSRRFLNGLLIIFFFAMCFVIY